VAWIKLLACHQHWQKWYERSREKHIDLSEQEQHITIFFILKGVLSQETLAEELCFPDRKIAQQLKEERDLLPPPADISRLHS
jgi:hypothetical protein